MALMSHGGESQRLQAALGSAEGGDRCVGCTCGASLRPGSSGAMAHLASASGAHDVSSDTLLQLPTPGRSSLVGDMRPVRRAHMLAVSGKYPQWAPAVSHLLLCAVSSAVSGAAGLRTKDPSDDSKAQDSTESKPKLIQSEGGASVDVGRLRQRGAA